MTITRSDRISGTIYVIADNAEMARARTIDYLRHQETLGEDDTLLHRVFDHQKDADKELHNRYGSYDTDRDRVYAISLDIRIATEK
ncbi:hypothetical protein ACFYQT_39925 [Streptomyces tibetensis]|uniref:Uncharacterized protein n=1 Tax=Streptomyces tibetensis TaxID=2382123 RepID=A0ABW6NCN9_9ACTN